MQDGFGAPVHGTSDECCAQCLAMAGCTGFAMTGGVCYFKNGTTTLPKPGVDTYLMRSSGELVRGGARLRLGVGLELTQLLTQRLRLLVALRVGGRRRRLRDASTVR